MTRHDEPDPRRAAPATASTADLLVRIRRPLLVCASVLAAPGAIVGLLGPHPTARGEEYRVPGLVIVVVVLVALVAATLVSAPGRRPKLLSTLTAGPGVALGALAANGMLGTPWKWLVALAAVAAFVVGLVAVLLDIESARDRPVSRL